MIKARKHITKKEIAHDPFLESINTVKKYFDENKNFISRVSLGFVALIVVGMLFNNNFTSKRETSESALGMAFVNLSSGDRDNGLLQLELIIDDYAGTKAARHSKFMLARLYYEQKNYLTAKLYLLDFLDDPTDEFHVGALILMADIEKFNGNSDGEEKYIKQSMKYASSKLDKDKYSITLAEYYMNEGNIQDALALVVPIIEKYERRSDLYNKAQEILGHLHTVSSDEQ